MEESKIVLPDKLQPGFIIICLMERKLHLKFPISTERCMHASILNLQKVTAVIYGTTFCPYAGGAAKPQ